MSQQRLEFSIKHYPGTSTPSTRRWIVTFNLEGTPIDKDKEDPFDKYLTAILYAIRSYYHQSHRHSPTQLVFGRDMFSPVSMDIDQNAIRANKQMRIDNSNGGEFLSRIPHTYNRGD